MGRCDAVGVLALTACASAPAPAEVTTQTAKPGPAPTPSSIPTPSATAIAAAVFTPTSMDAAVSPSEPPATPSPSPSPSPQAAPTPTASPTTQIRIDEDGPSGCVSDPNPRLTALITDLSKIDFIDPTPVLSGNWLKNRSYLAIGRDTGGQAYDVPIYAPADSTLVGVTYYLQPMQDAQGAWVDVPQYDLQFQVSCEVTYGFDHVERLADDLAALAPAEPARSTRDAQIRVELELKAGDLIGYTTGTILAHTWDFILNNSTKRNRFANQERYEGVGDLGGLLTGDCPFDYYDEELRSQYLALLGGFSGQEPDAAVCGGPTDVPGTIVGGWFIERFSPETFIGPEPGWGMAVGKRADGWAHINGAGVTVRTPPGHATYADPATVTGEHCYEHNSQPVHYAFVRLLSDTEMAVSFAEGRCPAQMPSAFEVFYR